MAGERAAPCVLFALMACGDAATSSRGDAAAGGGVPDAFAAPSDDWISFDAGIVPAGEGCEYLGQRFPDGVVFPANDGCNHCMCWDGLAGCSLVGCFRRAPACDVPFDPGPCDAALSFFHFDGETGACAQGAYGGCGGNLNRFDSYASCAVSCIVSGLRGKSCVHDGTDYAHGQRVKRPFGELTGCGPCLCNDGEVLCPPEDCACPDGQRLGVECTSAGEDGACIDESERCLPACATDADCDASVSLTCDERQGVCVAEGWLAP